MADILLVDDTLNLRRSLSLLLKNKGGYRITEAPNGQNALNQLKRQVFDLVITDVRMNPVDGIQVLKETKRSNPNTEVIVMTAFGNIQSGVQAMKLGAFDYITKPFNNDEFLFLVAEALKKQDKKCPEDRSELRREEQIGSIIGDSKAMLDILKLICKVAKTDSTVLIWGESGTGKELVARAVHAVSHRKDRPMITINCSSLSESLLESELFGHVKGAFTGAMRDKLGLFQEADGGTLFLDEIGEITLQTQVKLLRFLQEGEIRRVGDNRSHRVDVRIIAATNKNLEEEVAKNNFREDLFYRLNVIPFYIPPLRNRIGDIPLLAQHFLQNCAQKLNKKAPALSVDALNLLMNYQWPGNVRELENIMERTITLISKEVIEPEDLSFKFAHEYQKSPSHKLRKSNLTLEELEKSHILETLNSCRGNQKQAAEMLGIATTTLWRKLKNYRIDLADFNRISVFS